MRLSLKKVKYDQVIPALRQNQFQTINQLLVSRQPYGAVLKENEGEKRIQGNITGKQTKEEKEEYRGSIKTQK